MSTTPFLPTGRRARLAVVALATTGGLLLSGCGVADEGFRPGAAAVVDDAVVPVSEVDDAAVVLCEALGEAGQGAQPGNAVRSRVLQGLVLRTLADEINAEGYDVEPTEVYAQTLEQADTELADLSEGDRELLVPALTGSTYFVDLMTSVGQEELGITATDDPQGQQGLAAGIDLARDFAETHPIRTSPEFPAIELGEANIELERTDLSVAVSDFADRALTAGQEGGDVTLAEDLPRSQRCG